jgi:acetyl/propionyl-CoA carboxylase alpha subunit
MGRKDQARTLAESLGVPVVPATGFPMMIKAIAGGGGRGMRVVRSAAELEAACLSAGREAQKAFGEGTLLMERYIPGARHVEVQLLGDLHGNLIHLGERECSIQRRHQKVIEESPSPGLDQVLGTRLCGAALAIGRALKYSSAGTVEFLLAAGGEFYFIEVNTRIQVEHPVTELRTGQDLVALQIAIAEGRPLTLRQQDVELAGHAIEARLCAEDPGNGFLPATGRVEVWDPPAGVRLETAVVEGLEIGIHYDSLLGKVVAHGPDREAARRRLVDALERLAVQGVTTNREFLIRVLGSPEFREGRANTEFLDSFPAAAAPDPAADFRLATAAALFSEWRQCATRAVMPSVAPSYRNNPYRDPSTSFEIGGSKWEIHWRVRGGGRYTVRSGERSVEAEVLECMTDRIRLALDGVQTTFRIKCAGEVFYVRSPRDCRTVRRLLRHPPPESAARHETANSPMPGQVLRILVTEGQQVKAGDPLVVLEAMKMEQTIKTAIGGVVDAVLVKTGDIVMPGQMLVQITAAEKVEKTNGHRDS